MNRRSFLALAPALLVATPEPVRRYYFAPASGWPAEILRWPDALADGLAAHTHPTGSGPSMPMPEVCELDEWMEVELDRDVEGGPILYIKLRKRALIERVVVTGKVSL